MPELRKDPIIGRWIVFSPDRLHRPMNYLFNAQLPDCDPASDPFAEGHEAYTPPEVFAIREPHTKPNTPGWKVRVVPNRFPALRIEGDLNKEAVGFYDQMNGIGAHEVVIETPKSGVMLADLDLASITNVLKAYRARMLDLAHDSRFRYIFVFKNVGALAGASLQHAHSQIIALPVTPIVVKEKLQSAAQYFKAKDRSIFEDILRNELKAKERIVFENAGFGVFCPFASRVAFEMCLMPKQQKADFTAAGDHELFLLAEALKTVLQALNRSLNHPHYNIILHTAPLRRKRPGYWETLDFDFRWHLEILPRMAGIAGFELGTGFYINPVLPEDAAAFLRTGALP